MRSDTLLHEAIGKLTVEWAHLESRLDHGIALLNEYRRAGGDYGQPDGRPVSASYQFERARKLWKEEFAAIDLSGGQYACDTGKTAGDLRKHRHLRDLLVHGAPHRMPFTEDDLIQVRMSTAAKSNYFQASVSYKIREMRRAGVTSKRLKADLREFMARTGEVLIPFDEVLHSMKILPLISAAVSEAHLDLNRLIGDRLRQRFNRPSA